MIRLPGCCTAGDHRLLLAIAVLLWAFGCVTAVSLLWRSTVARGRLRAVWLAGAGIAFGCGVWTARFVAILALRPDLPLGFDLGATLLSAALACGGAICAFALYQAAPGRLAAFWVAAALLVLSAGLAQDAAEGAAMLPPLLSFDLGLAVKSFAVGVVAAGTALLLARRLDSFPRRAAMSAALMLCVWSAHASGVQALMHVPAAPMEDDRAALAAAALALAVAGIGAMVLLPGLGGSLLDQYLTRRMAGERQRLRQLADIASEGIVVHTGGQVLDANDAACRLLRVTRAELVGRRLSDYLAAGDSVGTADRLERPSSLPFAAQATLADGAVLDLELAIRPLALPDGRAATAVTLRDLTAARQAEARIAYLAHHDPLTGLPNRALLNDRLSQALELADRRGEEMAVFCVDLDRFTSVNDLLGQPAGDAVLQQAAARLSAGVRAMDTIARLGGDEFCIVQPLAAQPDAALRLARRIVDALAAPFEVDGQAIQIGASIGIALYPADGTSAVRLLQNAGFALYDAKQHGRGLFRFFEPAMDQRLQKRRRLEQDLRGAVAGRELELHYQPLVDAASSGVVGFEALLRWNRPGGEVVPPADFIPLAEETGLILPIGQWVLETACAEAAGWPEHLSVAVNLSPAQFRQGDLAEMVANILSSTGLPGHRLELEVTEGLLIDDTDRALEALVALKALGIRISLDDFGTGYSSLSYLHRFPFDKIKIDRSFVQRLGENDDAGEIIRAMIALAHSLGLIVTAEGVETVRQRQLLEVQRCQLLQGFLLAPPLAVGALGRLIGRIKQGQGDLPPISPLGPPLTAGR